MCARIWIVALLLLAGQPLAAATGHAFPSSTGPGEILNLGQLNVVAETASAKQAHTDLCMVHVGQHCGELAVIGIQLIALPSLAQTGINILSEPGYHELIPRVMTKPPRG